jgi:hypothetical protein
MSTPELLELLNALRQACAARGAQVQIELGDSASFAATAECERTLGVVVAPSLAAFLHRCNGMTIRYYNNSNPSVSDPECWDEKFEILNLALIVKATDSVRDLFELAADSSISLPGTKERGRQVLVLSDENHIVIYLALDRQDVSGECPVMKLDTLYYDDWLDDPGSPIAANVDDHVRRSLETMIRTGTTFAYWRLLAGASD